MLESKLSKQVYQFEKKFKYFHGQLDSIEEAINIQVVLTIDLIKSEFYLDLNGPLNLETGIILLYGQNLFGNTQRKTSASAEFYKWLGEICDFADKKLIEYDKPYDIYKDENVINISFKFIEFIQKGLVSKDSEANTEIWGDFERYSNPKPKHKHKNRNRDSEEYDLDDNK